MKNVIYLASGRAKLNVSGFRFFYNDLFESDVDFKCDMLDVDLSNFDVLIATPPCNFYSRANYRRFTSDYSLFTKHLLPTILDKFIASGKPFIVENVRNPKLFSELGLFSKNCFVYFHGRHTYWTNVLFNPSFIPQSFDFCRSVSKNGVLGSYRLHSYVQGGSNVNFVLSYWLYCLSFANYLR